MPDPQNPPAQPQSAPQKPDAPKQEDQAPEYQQLINIAKNAVAEAEKKIQEEMQGQPGIDQVLKCLQDSLACLGQGEQLMANPQQAQQPAQPPQQPAQQPAQPPAGPPPAAG
jgi:hypothetical protein